MHIRKPCYDYIDIGTRPFDGEKGAVAWCRRKVSYIPVSVCGSVLRGLYVVPWVEMMSTV